MTRPSIYVACLAAVIWVVLKNAPPQMDRLAPTEIYIIDGDSIRVSDRTIRLIGYNAPETRSAKCESERTLGLKAKEQLQTLVDDSKILDLQFETKASGGQKSDKYGRPLAKLFIDGVDAADAMITAKLAEPYSGGKRRDWCQ